MQGLGGQKSAFLGKTICHCLVFVFVFFPPPSFLEVASERFKCSKNKSEGDNKPLWNVAESLRCVSILSLFC